MASQFFKNVPVVCHRKKNYVFHNVFVSITIISEKDNKKEGKWQKIRFWANYPYKTKHDSHLP